MMPDHSSCLAVLVLLGLASARHIQSVADKLVKDANALEEEVPKGDGSTVESGYANAAVEFFDSYGFRSDARPPYSMTIMKSLKHEEHTIDHKSAEDWQPQGPACSRILGNAPCLCTRTPGSCEGVTVSRCHFGTDDLEYGSSSPCNVWADWPNKGQHFPYIGVKAESTFAFTNQLDCSGTCTYVCNLNKADTPNPTKVEVIYPFTSEINPFTSNDYGHVGVGKPVCSAEKAQAPAMYAYYLRNLPTRMRGSGYGQIAHVNCCTGWTDDGRNGNKVKTLTDDGQFRKFQSPNANHASFFL